MINKLEDKFLDIILEEGVDGDFGSYNTGSLCLKLILLSLVLAFTLPLMFVGLMELFILLFSL